MGDKDNIINLEKLSREQLIDLVIRQSLSSRNEVVVDDIKIASSEPLNIIEEMVNRLIEKNQNFLIRRETQKRNNILLTPRFEDE